MPPRTLRNALIRALTVLVMAAVGSTAAVVVGAAPAHADGCYTWTRNLSTGTSGEDVRQLQIRVAGWPGYGGFITIDGVFGQQTHDAVVRFQSAYGLGADGIAGAQTYSKIYSLQDDDCTPVHFAYSELNTCNSTWAGGNVSAATAKANALKVMWRLEALRHALGDQPIRVTSGFRSQACNAAVGGASDSQHLYGNSADLGAGSHTLCTMAKEARYHGFNGILGPGYPDHSDHVHADIRASRLWSASQCF
ncbi:muramoylpentapeptide carboxypeptidase [Catellatospora sp. TT07R-123]|uniref:D-Ala-D-Ala carboxypeptidase family metallohydrolase n=1 Tax=Catellatospora sp. TT07R-123 TaxID=2733863 RepID=UPI001B08D2B4|nr:D-Ala-D-Ala carboxypeptidase family metallohydrolase [Catellatospora sp. TT07R-123]GHJ45111.1 muramoylpentapeptide carboxypeptidase [Catellatospora sp. TT07R-123]